MPETLTDILAAALRSTVNVSDEQWSRTTWVDDLLAAIPARDREAWETGRALARLMDLSPGYGRLGWNIGADCWAEAFLDDPTQDGHDFPQVLDQPTLLAALTSLLAQLDPTR